MCQIITIDFKERVLVNIDTPHENLGPSFFEKAKQAVENNYKDGYIGLVFSPIGHERYLYGQTEFTKSELDEVITHFKDLGYITKTGKELDEEECEYTGDIYLDLTWSKDRFSR